MQTTVTVMGAANPFRYQQTFTSAGSQRADQTEILTQQAHRTGCGLFCVPQAGSVLHG